MDSSQRLPVGVRESLPGGNAPFSVTKSLVVAPALLATCVVGPAAANTPAVTAVATLDDATAPAAPSATMRNENGCPGKKPSAVAHVVLLSTTYESSKLTPSGEASMRY